MKKMLILAAATVALCSCSSNKYVIEGTIEGLSGTVYLLDETENPIDSTAVTNCSFRFTGKVESPAIRLLSDATDGDSSFSAVLILEPGTITVADDPQTPYRKRVSGTPSNDASSAYGDNAKALMQEYRDEATSDERREAIEQEYDQLSRKAVDENRNNYFGALILAQQLGYGLSGQELLDEIALFTPDIQQTELLTQLKQNARQKLETDAGKPYIDFAQPDADGNEIALKQIVENPANKYVLLDFWASWCGPCMGEVPYLKQTYEEFRNKGFEIYGVSLDEEREAWLDAVGQNGMNWIQVSSLDGFNNQAAKDYAVQSIPSNFLIDSKGMIVARNLRAQALYEKVSELLAE